MAAIMAPTADRISFMEPPNPRRPSTGAISNDSSNPEDHYEDWSKITHERDSWANRQRRRSNKFSKIDADMTLQANSRSRSSRRGSSVLGLFQQAVDKNGNPLLLSDDHHEDFEINTKAPSIAIAFPKDHRSLSMSSENSDKRRGSILSLWKTGKDKDGKDHIHSGHEGEDWEVITNGSSAPASPRLEVDRGDRRGSILSIWKQGKDREGRSVILSGEEHDEDDADLGGPLSQVVSATSSKGKDIQERERHGSILSIWAQGKDKDGKSVILSGEEHDGPTVIPVEKIVVPRGQERRPSVLSLWAEGKGRDGKTPAPVILSGFEEDEE